MLNRHVEAALGAGIFLLALGMLLWGIPAWVEPNDFAVIPPDLLPRVAVSVIAVLSALMVLHRLFLLHGSELTDVRPAMLAKGATLIAVFAAGVWLILNVGYLLGGVCLVTTLMLFMGARTWWLLAVTALGAPLFLFLFFDRLLGIPLP